MVLHAKLNEEKVVDNWKGKHRRIQKRNKQQARRTEPACKGNDLLLPAIQTQVYKQSALPTPVYVSCLCLVRDRHFSPPPAQGNSSIAIRTISLAETSFVLEQRWGH